MTLRGFSVWAVAAACLAAQAPVNDECTTAVAVFEGVNPSSPNGASGTTFTNANANTSAAFPNEIVCGGNFGMTRDVFFTYTASGYGGTTTISTCTPPGFAAGTSADTMLAVYDASVCPAGGTSIACNDDGCSGGSSSKVTFTATPGASYLIRVGSWGFGVTAGTFYLTVNEAPPNDLCANALALGPFDFGGVTTASAYTTGATFTATPGVFLYTGPMTDVWFTFQAPQAGIVSSTCPSKVVEIYGGSCGGLTFHSTVAGNFTPPTAVAAGQTYYVRVFSYGPADPNYPDGFFTLTVNFKPSNDEPAGAIPLNVGVNPAIPSSPAGQVFTTRGATDSVGGTNKDVYFTWTANESIPATIELCPPAGSNAASWDADLNVTQNGAFITYGDEECSPLPSVTFSPTAGATYVIRVGGWSSSDQGDFHVTVRQNFTLLIDSPNGPGTIRIANRAGAPGAVYYSALTLTNDGFPNGWFYGVSPSLLELVLQLTAAAPFVGILDASGNSTFNFGPGLPPLTIYGVTVQFGATTGFDGNTPPVVHTIP